MNIYEIWLIYLVIVLVVWITLVGSDAFKGWSSASRLLVALIIGALVVIFLSGCLITTCPDENFWISLLFIFAFLAPILIALWLLATSWGNVKSYVTGCDDVKVDRKYVCNGDVCWPLETTVRAGDGITTFLHE